MLFVNQICRKRPFCNTKYLVNTLFTHISTSFGIDIRLFPANLLKTPSNDKILPEASSRFFTYFGFNKHNIKVIVGKNNTNSFSEFVLFPNGGGGGIRKEHAVRRNSGEPSPDLCAEYTQDGEPRQPRVANPSAQAMENPAENGGILLAER